MCVEGRGGGEEGWGWGVVVGVGGEGRGGGGQSWRWHVNFTINFHRCFVIGGRGIEWSLVFIRMQMVQNAQN